MTLLSYEDIAREIVSRCDHGRVNLVAVDGPAGSGKSTLTGVLAPMLQAPIIELDDFISMTDMTSFWPRFEEQVLQPLASGQPAHYQVRDWSDFMGDSLGAWKTVQRAPIMFIEGTTSSRLAIAEQLTMSIWVQAPRALRLQRGIERDGEGVRAAWLDWMRMEDEWFAQDNTLWRAELKIDGDPDPSVDRSTFVQLLDD